MRILYLDCPSGISGNMTLGALLEILDGLEDWEKGLAEKYFSSELAKLRVDGYKLDITRRASYGITGTYVDVILDEVDVHEHAHQHEHRTYSDIYNMIENSDISEGAKDYAEAIFYTIAEAESKVHGVPMEEVHFHEVGAIDSIVDIVGTAILLDKLAPSRILSSVVNEGCGWINCAHGKMRVPVPATAEIFKTKGVRFIQTNVETELVTPTGAGILATLAEDYGTLPEMTIKAIGYGLGSKDIGYANALRIFLGEAPEEDSAIFLDEKVLTEKKLVSEDIVVIETNIDDSTGEELGYALERLLEAGARDAFFTPIFMKKNRPAYKLSVICKYAKMEDLAEIIFHETTSIGVRYYKVDRVELERELVQVETEYGLVTCKRVITPRGAIYVYPEYEDMKKIAQECNIPLNKVRQAALDAGGRLK